MNPSGWIAQQWETARLLCLKSGSELQPALLILDEMQKISGWSETVKRLWDEDTAAGLPLRVLLLGSSPLLLREGLTESLAGRFETLRATHCTRTLHRSIYLTRKDKDGARFENVAKSVSGKRLTYAELTGKAA